MVRVGLLLGITPSELRKMVDSAASDASAHKK